MDPNCSPYKALPATLAVGPRLAVCSDIWRGKLDGQNAYKATHQHVWGLYLDEQLVYDHDADSDGDFDDIGGSDKRYYVVHDFLYSASAVMDPSAAVKERYDYEPYGKPTFWSGDYSDTRDETQVTTIFLFTGQMYDAELGLYHYKARAYHPIAGRFIQRDPLDQQLTHVPAAGRFSPLHQIGRRSVDALVSVSTYRHEGDAMSLRVYGRSHPVRGTDPTGKVWAETYRSIKVKMKDVDLLAADVGHWWISLGDGESYGFWPKGLLPEDPNERRKYLVSTDGELNGTTNWGGRSNLDPNDVNRVKPDREVALVGSSGWRIWVIWRRRMEYGPAKGKICCKVTESEVKDCIRGYAQKVAENPPRWSLFSYNCRTFVRIAIDACCIDADSFEPSPIRGWES